MYALGLAALCCGVLMAIGGAAVAVSAILESSLRIAIWLSIAVFVSGIVLAVWGGVTVNSEEREQCEAAGFEWITGTCYGSNVNVNK